MANATTNLIVRTQGRDGYKRHHPVDGGAHLYKGTLISQLTATGACVPTSTASSGPAIGVAQHEVDNSGGSDGDLRVEVEHSRIFEFENDVTIPFDEADLIGAPAYAVDDHTVSPDDGTATRQVAGTFEGLEASGRVAVRVDPHLNARI
jgi:hypothetical protein